MGTLSRRLRAGSHVIVGRRRAATVAARLGTGLRDARVASGKRQVEAARDAGISQTRYSELERGLGATAPLETWAVAAAAVGEQLVGLLEAAPGATPPRDIERLRRQAALVELARAGGWQAHVELALDPGAVRSRSADAMLLRAATREAILGEIWDWFDDVGSSLRSLDSKRDALLAKLAREHGGEWTLRCLYVIRRTRRNERPVAELRMLFAARFRGSATAWLRAITDPQTRLPAADGLVWSTSTYRLQPSRLGRSE